MTNHLLPKPVLKTLLSYRVYKINITSFFVCLFVWVVGWTQVSLFSVILLLVVFFFFVCIGCLSISLCPAHFWLYRLYTVYCTGCTLLNVQIVHSWMYCSPSTVQTVHFWLYKITQTNKQTNGWNLIHRKRRRLANFFTLTLHFYKVKLVSRQQLTQSNKQTAET